jgi:prepilin-type N-terminal cleavage/methylation domain-containing protein
MLKLFINTLARGQKGFTFIEVIIGILIITIVVAAFLGAMGTAYNANYVAQVRTTAESIARAQLEYVKSQPYDDFYDPFLPIDEGYDVLSWDFNDIEPEHSAVNDNEIATMPAPGIDGAQFIKVRITHHDNTILELTQYRVDK